MRPNRPKPERKRPSPDLTDSSDSYSDTPEQNEDEREDDPPGRQPTKPGPTPPPTAAYRLQHLSTCPVCHAVFAREQDLRRHLARQHNTRIHTIYFCQHCVVQYDIIESMNAHITLHHKHICAICQKSFKSEKDKAKHDHNSPHHCHKCNSTYASKTTLLRHTKSQHITP